jgi:hypothetical protein
VTTRTQRAVVCGGVSRISFLLKLLIILVISLVKRALVPPHTRLCGARAGAVFFLGAFRLEGAGTPIFTQTLILDL